MPKDNHDQKSPELLDALESIKGLLEQSESKLSAARESLKKANPQTGKQGIVRPSASNEPVVPVLDDVVTTMDDNLAEDDVPLLDEDIPELDNILEAEPVELQPPLPSQGYGHSTDEVLSYIDTLQKQLEKELRNTLMRTVVNIETEIKKTLTEQIQKLKAEIEQNRDD